MKKKDNSQNCCTASECASWKMPRHNAPARDIVKELSLLKSDIIELIPNQVYRFIISYESGSSAGRITPTVTLPEKKGYMILKGQRVPFMLSTCNSPEHPSSEVTIMSELGKIDISFHCKTRDHRGTPYWGSSKVLRPLGMKKEEISPTKVRYSCTNLAEDSLGCYVFTVEWESVSV